MTQAQALNGHAQKELDQEAVARSVQVQPPGQGPFYGAGEAGLFFVASAADEIDTWGRRNKLRDKQLRDFIPAESTFTSALGIVSARNAAFGWTLEGPDSKVAKLQARLQGANFGRGWQNLIQQVSIDLYTQDDGAFIEVIRAGNTPDSEVISLAHLDAARCYHTGIPETPVLYIDQRGRHHELKWYQVLALSEMPATWETIPGKQYCALTRLMRSARFMRDVAIYMTEKVGGRQARAVTLVKGITPEKITEAWEMAKLNNDSAGLMRYSQPVFVGSVNPNADLGFETLELASLPDGFSLDLSQKQYILQLAMAFFTDYQEFAPLPGGGLGTSAQSQVLHQKSRGKGPGLFMKLVTQALNFNVLPADVEFKFDEQDSEEDKLLADTQLVRAQARKARIESGELTPQVAQLIAHQDGDLTTEQLEALQKQEEAQRQESIVPDTSPDAASDAIDGANQDAVVEDTDQAQESTPAASGAPKPPTMAKDTTKARKDKPILEPTKERLDVEDKLQSVLAEAFASLAKKLV